MHRNLKVAVLAGFGATYAHGEIQASDPYCEDPQHYCQQAIEWMLLNDSWDCSQQTWGLCPVYYTPGPYCQFSVSGCFMFAASYGYECVWREPEYEHWDECVYGS